MSRPTNAPKKLGARLLLVSLLLLGSRVPGAEPDDVNIVVGGQKTFAADGIQNYSVTPPKHLQVAVSSDGRTLVVKALKPGTATLLLIHENKAEPDRTVNFNIFARDPVLVMKELSEVLRIYPDVQVRQNGPQIIVQGSVNTPRDEAAIKEVMKNYPDQVVSTVTVGPSGSRRNVMIQLDLHYVQVRRRLTRSLGLHYPPSIGNATQSGGGGQGNGPSFQFGIDFIHGGPSVTQAQYSIVTDLLPWLDLTESSGFIRVRRVDTIVTENGAKATYRDGSEIFLKLVGGLSQGRLEKVFYGSELTVTPRLSAANDSISLDLVASLSQRDNAGTTDGIPGRLVDHIETSVHLPVGQGQSVMLAGVQSKAHGRTTTGLPWLNRLPIVGYLFGSEQVDREDADGLLFITPSLIQSSSRENQTRIDDVLKHFEDP